MKKSLVALAALAATASFAQSTVTISGIMDAGYVSSTQPGNQTYAFIGQSGARTTTFKFNGSEDLGGGQAAIFQFEVQPSLIGGNGNTLAFTNPNTATVPVANGLAQGTGNTANAQPGLVGKGMSFVGFQDAQFGTVRAGTINSGLFETYAAVSVMGTGIGTAYGTQGVGGGVIPDITRYESAIKYDTPVIAGFSGNVMRGTGNDSQFGTIGTSGAANSITPRRPTVTDYSVGYANGPLSAKYGVTKSVGATGDVSSAANVTTNTKLLGVAYDAGVAKVTYGTGSRTSDYAASPADIKINVMGVVVPFMGTYRFLAQSSYYKVNTVSTAVNSGDKNKVTGWGVEKDLSKRTYAYLRAENADFAANAASGYVVNGAALTGTAWGANNSTRKITMVGVSHQF